MNFNLGLIPLLPFLGATVLSLVLSLLAIGVNLLKPWPLKFIVDQILPSGSAFRSRGSGRSMA